MTKPANNQLTDARRSDARADRTTFLWTAAFIFAGMTVTILSAATELQRANSAFPVGKVVLYEITGFLSFLAMFPLIAWLVTRSTPGQHSWRQVIPVHLAASLGVVILHVSLFVLLRKALVPVFFGEPYFFTDNLARDFIYEYRKSVLAYGIVLFAITFGRELEQKRRELAAAREDAKKSHRLTLKCGGRSIFVDASDVIWAKSASNYVEVKTPGAEHLARATLASIERQLGDAGANAVRVHRSWIVNADYISRIEPTGEGDLKIEMKDGATVPGSRRYRGNLNLS